MTNIALNTPREFDATDASDWPPFRPTADPNRPPTAEEMHLILTEAGVEFSDGELLEHHASMNGSAAVVAVAAELVRAARHEPADVLSGKMPYQCWPGRHRYRKPDATVVTHACQAAAGIGPDDDPETFEIVPNLAVEVLSMHDRPGRLNDKLREYRQADFPLVWTLDPKSKTVKILRLGQPPVTLAGNDQLTLSDLLPKFRVKVGDLFA